MKKLRIILALLIIIGFLLIGYRVLHISNYLNKEPLINDQVFINNQERSVETTLLVLEKRDYEKGTNEIMHGFLFVQNAENATALIFYIPSWVYIGEERFSTINHFGLNDSFGGGYSLLTQKLGNQFALKINSLIAIEYSDEDVDINKLFRKNTQITDLFLNDKLGLYYADMVSNLNYKELLQKWFELKQIAKKTQIIKIENDYLVEELISTGEFVYKLNTSKIDSTINSNSAVFFDKQVKKEQARVEVYNAGSSSGMASLYSRILTNLGFNVIRYGNCPVSYDKTTIFVSDKEKFAQSLNIVRSLFIIDVVIVEERPDFMNTGDIVIIIN